MKTNLICATLVLLAIIAAVVAGCVVADSAWPLIVLPFCNLDLPKCTVVKPSVVVPHCVVFEAPSKPQQDATETEKKKEDTSSEQETREETKTE